MERSPKRTVRLLPVAILLLAPACAPPTQEAERAAAEHASQMGDTMAASLPTPAMGARPVQEVIEVARDGKKGALSIVIPEDHPIIPLSHLFRDVVHWTCGGVCSQDEEIAAFDVSFKAYVDCRDAAAEVEDPGFAEPPFARLPASGPKPKSGRIVSPPVEREWIWTCWKMKYAIYDAAGNELASSDPHIFASP